MPRPMDQRSERIVCETDFHRISGDVALPREGYRSRLSDYLNHHQREFIPLENAEVVSLTDPEQVRHMDFLLVQRTHIRMVVPEEG